MLRLITFADGDAEAWGAAWSAGETGLVLSLPGAERSGAAELEAPDELGDWRLSAPGAELLISPLGEGVHTEPLDGFDQLVRVTGEVQGADGAAVVDTLGRRALRHEIDLREVDSIRDVSCWFEPDRGLALTAMRPRRTKGHDRDVVAAAVLGLAAEHPVSDPRLSTTYRADGRPLRAGLELWLSDDEDEEQYPTRAAGELAGDGLRSTIGALQVAAEPFRWHSQGAEGGGLYLLMQPG